MPNDTKDSAKSTVEETPLLWELLLPDNAFKEAADYSLSKGREDLALYEGTRVYSYQMALCTITSLLNDVIKLVHFDGLLLHIFMEKDFPSGSIATLKRLFSSQNYLPDRVLNDILTTQQAIFSVREQEGDNVIETSYVGLTSYEGEVDYTDIRKQLVGAGIVDLTTVALVFDVDSIRETPYENARYDNIESRFIGSQERLVDTLMFARELQHNHVKRRAVVQDARKYFASRAVKPVLRPAIQKKEDSIKALKESNDAFKRVRAEKKAERNRRLKLV